MPSGYVAERVLAHGKCIGNRYLVFIAMLSRADSVRRLLVLTKGSGHPIATLYAKAFVPTHWNSRCHRTNHMCLK
jgi:hypothetical protein